MLATIGVARFGLGLPDELQDAVPCLKYRSLYTKTVGLYIGLRYRVVSQSGIGFGVKLLK